MDRFDLHPIGDESAVIGVIYVDAVPRASKKVQAAQFTLQGSKVLYYAPDPAPEAVQNR